MDLWNPGYPATPQRPTILSTPSVDPTNIPYPAGFPIGPTLPGLPPSTWVPQAPPVYLARGDDAIDNIISDEALFGTLAALAAPELGGAAALARYPAMPAFARMLATRGASAEMGGGALVPQLPRYLGLAAPGTMLATPSAAAGVDSGGPAPQRTVDEDFKSSSNQEQWKPKDPVLFGPSPSAPTSTSLMREASPGNAANDFIDAPAPAEGGTQANASSFAPFGMLSDLTFDPVAKRWLTLPERVNQIRGRQPESAPESDSDLGIGWPGLLFGNHWPTDSGASGWGGTAAPAPDYWTLRSARPLRPPLSAPDGL
jgi:hypothetical protein